MRQSILLLLLTSVMLAQLPAHMPTNPSVHLMAPMYSLGNEPVTLRPGILAWIATHFDLVTSTIAPKNGPVYWTQYIESSGTYLYQAYGVRDVAEAIGSNLEDVFLHSSRDLKYDFIRQDMEQFDAFERTGLGPSSASKGVFTWSGNSYTDVTVPIYGGSHRVTVSDTLYVGYMEPFDQINVTVSKARVDGSVTYQYWNGLNWATLAPQTDGTNELTRTGQLCFYPPHGWRRIAVNGSRSKYWVRFVVTKAKSAPELSRLYGDNWISTLSGMNGRGWSASDTNRINVGTPLEYNPHPPADATARFRYQARTAAGWTNNTFYMNPARVLNGKSLWAEYLVSLADGNADGVQFDSVTGFPSGAIMPYTEIRNANGWQSAKLQLMSYLRNALHAQFGPNYKVGGNITNAALNYVVDWAYQESARYTAYSLSDGDSFTNNWKGWGNNTYDAMLPIHNPRNAKAFETCFANYINMVGPQWGFATWHYWDRGNRAPINCLAQHYVAANENTGMSYYTGSFRWYYKNDDQVYVYGPTTVTTSDIAADNSSGSKSFTITDPTGCAGDLELPFVLGDPHTGDTIPAKLTGRVATTTWPIYHPYPAGTKVTCVQLRHQSLLASAPPSDAVYSWGAYFPAISVDIGVPLEARQMKWRKGGAPDYISGLSHAECDKPNAGKCADLHKRAYTRALVMYRERGGKDAEMDTYSRPIALGGMYYPLKSDGTTEPGITSIQLRASEGAVLMKQSIETRLGRSVY